MASEEAESHKEKGNAAFKEKSWDEAVKHYNKAINLDPNNAAYYSNRSGAWSSKGSHESALNDAEKCLQIDPGFVKGYSRKGKALFDMQRWDEAEAAYQEGLAKDPSNAGCKQGVADVGNAKLAREAAAARSRSQSSGGGIFGNIKNMVSQPSKLLKRVGKGGRLQMYVVVLASWYGYQYFVGGRGKSSKTAKEKAAVQGHEEAEEDEEPEAQAHAPRDVAAVALDRGFVEADGSWLGFVRAEGRKQNPLLLLLHRTSLSAETEYGPAIARLAKAGPSGGLSILAPDRPCHGYSPCPPGGEPRNATAWLGRLIDSAASASVPRSIAVVAAGREAAAQALALARERQGVGQVWLLSPHAAVPRRSARAPRSVAELSEWLQGHRAATSAAAAADAAGWVLRVDRSEEEMRRPAALSGAGLPRSCQVTILSDDEDQQQDDELTAALEDRGVTVNTLSVGSRGALDTLVEDVDSVLQGGSPSGGGSSVD